MRTGVVEHCEASRVIMTAFLCHVQANKYEIFHLEHFTPWTMRGFIIIKEQHTLRLLKTSSHITIHLQLGFLFNLLNMYTVLPVLISITTESTCLAR